MQVKAADRASLTTAESRGNTHRGQASPSFDAAAIIARENHSLIVSLSQAQQVSQWHREQVQ